MSEGKDDIIRLLRSHDRGEPDEGAVRIADRRLFAGLTEEETAEGLGLSVRTVRRDWKRTRGWLKEEMPR